MRWPEVDGLADALVRMDRDRELLGSMARSAVNFAARNTQDIWLQRRLGWLRAAMPQPAQ
jgi:hypothetical protein